MKLAILFSVASCLVCGEEAPSFLKEKGWRSLVHAGSLRSWKAQESKPSLWSAEGKELQNGPVGKTANLVTREKFGDVELYLEYIVPKGSNSGVYLHGLYEVQIFDSYGVDPVKTSDAGAIYHRWIDNKPVGGSAPKVNASKQPGEWQSFRIWFRSPRFDRSGKKIESAKFIKVLHNGQLVQENVEVDGGTRAHMNVPEAVQNPLMLQGDHGPVRFRNIYVRPLGLTP